MVRDFYSSYSFSNSSKPIITRYLTVGVLGMVTLVGTYTLFFSEPKSIFSDSESYLEDELLVTENEPVSVAHLDDLLEK